MPALPLLRVLRQVFLPQVCDRTHTTGSNAGSCHLFEKSVIPARVMIKWDFGEYFVSHVARQFIDSILAEPLFDVAYMDDGLLLRKVKSLRQLCHRRKLLDMARCDSGACFGPSHGQGVPAGVSGRRPADGAHRPPAGVGAHRVLAQPGARSGLANRRSHPHSWRRSTRACLWTKARR